MFADIFPSPLLRWDGVHFVLNLEMLERYLRAYVTAMENVRDLSLEGEGDAIRIRARVAYKGVSTSVRIDLAEIRLKHRHLGFRLRQPRALGGMPLPRRMVEQGLKSAGLDELTIVAGEGIVIVDLRRWIPEQVNFSIRTVQATERYIHLWLGPGSVDDIPQGTVKSLTAGE